MKTKQPRGPKEPKSPFPSAKGKAPADPALFDALDELEGMAPTLLQHPDRKEPRWVAKAGEIVARAGFPTIAFRKDAPRTASAGAMVGRLDALDAWLTGELELPIPPEVEAQQKEALRQLRKLKVPPPVAEAMVQKTKELLAWLSNRPKRRRAFAKIAAAVARAPYTEAREFQHAHDQGSELRKDWVGGNWMSREATLCTLLVYAWPLWERFPSISALHRAFAKNLKPGQAGDLKSFHRLCRKIGFRLRGRGRPRKQK